MSRPTDAVEALADPGTVHPTWTHGSMVERNVSGITRAELVRTGWIAWRDARRTVAAARG